MFNFDIQKTVDKTLCDVQVLRLNRKILKNVLVLLVGLFLIENSIQICISFNCSLLHRVRLIYIFSLKNVFIIKSISLCFIVQCCNPQVFQKIQYWSQIESNMVMYASHRGYSINCKQNYMKMNNATMASSLQLIDAIYLLEFTNNNNVLTSFHIFVFQTVNW